MQQHQVMNHPPLRPIKDIRLDDIPLATFEKPKRPYDVDDTTDDDEDVEEDAKTFGKELSQRAAEYPGGQTPDQDADTWASGSEPGSE